MKAIVKCAILIVILFAMATTLVAQTITSINPDNGQQCESLAVAITGQNTHFQEAFDLQQGSPTTIWFSIGSQTVYGRDTQAVNDQLLITQLDIPCNAATGQQDVSIYNDIDGTLTLNDSFAVTQYGPTLTSITPRDAHQAQSLAVTITGRNTRFEQGSYTTFQQGSSTAFHQGTHTNYWFSQGTRTTSIIWLSQGSETVYSRDCGISADELLMAQFDIPPDANTGLWDVHVPTIDGVLTLAHGLLVMDICDSCIGDIDGDRFVTLLDVIALYQTLVNSGPPWVLDPTRETPCGDYDGDGLIGLLDVLALFNDLRTNYAPDYVYPCP